MNLRELLNQISRPEDVTNTFYPEDIKSNQLSGILASFPVFFWLPLVISKDSPYGKFCANQGLILFAFWITMSVLKTVLGVILPHILLIGSLLNWLVSLIIFAACAGAFLLLFLSACQGKARKIPLIGNVFDAFK